MTPIANTETIRQIMLRTSTSALIQIVCGLHHVAPGIVDINVWSGEKPVRVLLESHRAVEGAILALNRRIPKEASWDDGFKVEET